MLLVNTLLKERLSNELVVHLKIEKRSLGALFLLNVEHKLFTPKNAHRNKGVIA